MTPYYQDDSVTIYHGDALEILPTITGADLLLTDPPYGLNTSYGRSELGHRRIAGDKDTALLRWVSREAANVLADDRWAAIFCGYTGLADVLGGVSEAGLTVKTAVVWDKEMPGLGEGIRNQYELAVLARKGRPTETWVGGNVWRLNRIRAVRPVHPHEKPMALLQRFVERFSSPGDLVVDPFAGSGTTLVAAKASGRRAIGIEIEERWCEWVATKCSQEVLGLGA